MKFNKWTLGLVAIASIFCAGCGVLHVPKTVITGKIMGQPFELETPKDTDLRGLEIGVSSNSVLIKIESLSAVMNPTNIMATGAASSQLAAVQGANATSGINAAGNFVGTALAAYAEKMGMPKLTTTTTNTP